jgi:hypothetical protein
VLALIYLITFIIFIFLTMLNGLVRGLNTPVAVVMIAWMTLLASIRYETGTDFFTYTQVWSLSPALADITLNGIISGFFEPLFVVSNAVLKTFTTSPTAFFTFYACLTIIPLAAALARFDINRAYALLLYLCIFYLPYTFNGMRQSVAMTVFILAVPAILQHRTRDVILWTLLAAGFHSSGFVIAISYCFLRLSEHWNMKGWKVFAVSAVIGGVFAATNTIGQLFFRFFPELVTVYSEIFVQSSSWSNVLMRLGICGLMLLGLNQGKGPRRSIEQLFIIYCLGLLIYLSLSHFNMLATRFNMMFRVLEIVMFPMIMMRLSREKRLLFATLTIIFAAMLFLTVAQHPDYHYKTNIFGE